MAQVRKYAHLLDIDDSPDVYESPEVEDGVQGTTKSPGFSDEEDEDDTKAAGVSRSRLQLDQARNRFENSRVDASSADFSDRVSAKKQSYIVSTRKKKRATADENGAKAEEIESEDEDDDEGLARRIARLNREIEEVRAVLRQRDDQNEGQEGTKSKDSQTPGTEDISALSRALDSIQESQRQAISAHARLAKQLAEPMPQAETSEVPLAQASAPQDPTDEETLSKIAAFDARLSSLETSLGLNAMDISSSNSASVVPILPTLSLLDQQIALLSSQDNVPNLEGKLQALQTLQRGSAQTNGTKEDDEDTDDTTLSAEDITQLRSLYSLIPTLNELGPSVPALLSRLRSLRHLHADAAQAGQLMSDLERRQDETEKDIKAWRTGIEKVEEAVKKAEEGFKGNSEEVEKWVRELEGKLKDLDANA
ncbi:dynamitin-like protein [Elsinoe australis]|uniref:Dynamitin-like protein n=1 Tax=Elsinoe australis TaxID=40998 RepID=A0A4U7B237_9PEZI|nr:dynamitin-like protein [Elsinoe australis]